MLKKLHSHAEPLTRIRFQDDPYLEEIFSALAEHKNVSVSYQNYSGARRRSTLSVWGVGTVTATGISWVLTPRRHGREPSSRVSHTGSPAWGL